MLDVQFDKNEYIINDPMLIREVNRIQRIIEGQNLEIKKTLYKYSHLLETQRQVFFDNRADTVNNNFAAEFFQTNSPEKCDSYQSIIGSSALP